MRTEIIARYQSSGEIFSKTNPILETLKNKQFHAHLNTIYSRLVEFIRQFVQRQYVDATP